MKSKTKKKTGKKSRRAPVNSIHRVQIAGNEQKSFDAIVNEFDAQLSRYSSFAGATFDILNKFRNDGELNIKSDNPPVADCISKFNELNYRLMKLNDLHEQNLNKLNTLI